jgi:hypothetical protein
MPMNSNVRNPLAVLAAVLFVAVWMGIWVTRTVLLTPDSRGYALTSQYLVEGRGLRGHTFNLNCVPDDDGTVHLTCQPPGMPLAYAALGGVRPQRHWPIRVVNTVSLMTIGAAVAGWLLLTGRIVAAGAAGTMTVVLPGLVRVSAYGLSEPPFVAAVTLCLLLMFVSRRRPERWWISLGVGAMAAAAILFRFAGAFLLPLIVYEAGVHLRRHGLRHGLSNLVVTLALPVFTLGGLLLRNLHLTGTIRGFAQPQPHRTLWQAVAGTVGLLGPSLDLWFPAVQIAFYVALLAIAAGLAFHLARRGDARRRMLRDGADLLVASSLLYVSLIVYIMWRYQPRFEERFLVPLLPMLVLLLTMTLTAGGWPLWPKARGAVWRRGVVVLVWLTACGLAANGVITGLWRRWPYPEKAHTEAAMAWLREKTPASSRYVSNLASVLAYRLHRPGIWLPSKSWNQFTEIGDFEEGLTAIMRDRKAHYLVLGEVDTVKETIEGPLIARLARGEASGTEFEQVYSDRWWVVYRLEPEAGASKALE